jgi:homoserine kinase type II
VAYPEERIRDVLRTGWQRVARELIPLPTGPGVWAWEIRVDEQRFVLRMAPRADRRRIEAGLAAVEHLCARRLPASHPVRTADGALTGAVDDAVLALLRPVSGRPLEADDPLDQQWWGDLLGRIHSELTAFEHPGLLPWHWVRPEAGHLDLEPWLRPAVSGAVAAVTKLTVTDQLTYGVLHGAPTARTFRIDVATGRTGLTGWGPAATGPLVYDLAAAVIDAGGQEAATELVDGYLAAAPPSRDEIDAALPVVLRSCWAVQADRCARRLATAFGTGQPWGAAGAGGAPSPVDVVRICADAARIRADAATLRADAATLRADAARARSDAARVQSESASARAESASLRVRAGRAESGPDRTASGARGPVAAQRGLLDAPDDHCADWALLAAARAALLGA